MKTQLSKTYKLTNRVLPYFEDKLIKHLDEALKCVIVTKGDEFIALHEDEEGAREYSVYTETYRGNGNYDRVLVRKLEDWESDYVKSYMALREFHVKQQILANERIEHINTQILNLK